MEVHNVFEILNYKGRKRLGFVGIFAYTFFFDHSEKTEKNWLKRYELHVKVILLNCMALQTTVTWWKDFLLLMAESSIKFSIFLMLGDAACRRSCPFYQDWRLSNVLPVESSD